MKEYVKRVRQNYKDVIIALKMKSILTVYNVNRDIIYLKKTNVKNVLKIVSIAPLNNAMVVLTLIFCLRIKKSVNYVLLRIANFVIHLHNVNFVNLVIISILKN